MSTTRTGRLLQYGMCLNEDCPKCKSKEIQQISARKELVCSECGQPLRECPAPKSAWEKNKKLFVAAAAVVILGGVGTGVYLASSSDNQQPVSENTPKDSVVATQAAASTPATVASTDTVTNAAAEKIAEAEAPVEETKNSIPQNNTKATTASTPSQTKSASTQDAAPQSARLGCGRYEGPMSGGTPNGIGGTVYITSSHQVDLKDGAGGSVSLSAGDKIVNTKFKNGVLQQGQLIRSNGERKYMSGLAERL